MKERKEARLQQDLKEKSEERIAKLKHYSRGYVFHALSFSFSFIMASFVIVLLKQTNQTLFCPHK